MEYQEYPTKHTCQNEPNARDFSLGTVACAARSLCDLPVLQEPNVTLIVNHDCSLFRIGNMTIDLGRRKPLRRILEALVQRNASNPSQVISTNEMIVVGWPGEKILPTAGANRVRVAIATLRNLGLGDILTTGRAGYRLSSRVIVELHVVPQFHEDDGSFALTASPQVAVLS